MKSLHRIKAVSAYNGARAVLKQDMAYPAYMLLKESARGVLSYIAEDCLDMEISEKTKLSRLMELIPETLIDEDIRDSINQLIEMEQSGLEHILSIETETLVNIKKSIKKLIITYLKEPV